VRPRGLFTQEAEAGGSQGRPGLHNESLSQTKENKTTQEHCRERERERQTDRQKDRDRERYMAPKLCTRHHGGLRGRLLEVSLGDRVGMGLTVAEFMGPMSLMGDTRKTGDGMTS
jgi:hypothetical protein